MPAFTATYSPEDNKLRLYAASRLDTDLYARAKAAGFSWAPHQQLFVAPMWTPEREDLLIELAGTIDDEDTSLVERAEERANRFDDYRDNRLADATSAEKGVRAIMDSIPPGQPMLVGHHSEARARRDKKRIDSGMCRAVHIWETAEYWQQRAAGALRHAKYKERPAVRARRIKRIEADLRKSERNRAQAVAALAAWSATPMPIEKARRVANYNSFPCVEREGTWGAWSAWDVLQSDGKRYDACPSMTVDQVQQLARQHYPPYIARLDRWIAHYQNRLAYERALLADDGGTVADCTKPEKGGAVRCWASPGFGRGWAYIQRVNQVSVTIHDKPRYGDRLLRVVVPFDKLNAVMTADQVAAAHAAGRLQEVDQGAGFFLLDGPPAPTEAAPAASTPPPVTQDPGPGPAAIAAMRDQLRGGGVQIATVPHLFCTSPELAQRMVALAKLERSHRVLEPSAGMGALMTAIGDTIGLDRGVAIEINHQLAARLEERFPQWLVYREDFLIVDRCNIGLFDRILMNPPFDHGVDIKHIERASTMLCPGGRLVTVCANGPLQRSRLMPLTARNGGSWHDLAEGAFKHAGTRVNTALLVINA
jgi:phospholipid N-methyltransferase